MDNSELGIFDSHYAKSLEVDAYLYTVWDYRARTDVNKYCSYMLDYEDLLTHQAQVEQDLRKWHVLIAPICCHLELTQLCCHVHPYLQGPQEWEREGVQEREREGA